MIIKNYYVVKTLTGKYYKGKMGYDNADFSSDPVRLNNLLIPLSNIDYIRFGLTEVEARELHNRRHK